MKFRDKEVQSVTERDDIRIPIEDSTQEITDVLYISGMSVNLLSIIALDRRGFTVFFESQKIIITDQRTDTTVAHECAVNGLYELTNSTSDRAFVSDDELTNEVKLIEAQASEVSRVVEVTDIAKSRDIAESRDIRLNEEYQYEPSDQQSSNQQPLGLFELMHQRLEHPGSYRMKDLHRHAEGVKPFDVPKDFQCDICDQSKMIRKINREPQIKTTVPDTRLHSDY